MSDAPYGLLLQEPPYFEPPAPPPPPPTPPPAKRHPIRNVLAGIAIFLLFVLLGSAVGSQLAGSHPAGTSSTANPAAVTTTAADGVDAAVVDITTTLAGGSAADTGIVLTSDGLVLTNNHVIDGATSIKVQIAGTGPTYTAHTVGYDVTDDVAVIQLEDVSDLATASIGDSSSVNVGDGVTAIGNALGRSGPHSVTAGKVTALDQPITAGDASGLSNGERLTGLIEFNASLLPGDSGGPLVDAQGEVVGLNTAASVGGNSARGRGRTSSSTGYAIPINTAMDIAQKIEDGQGSATIHIGTRAILGVQIQTGATVAGVATDSPAASAGIAAGDVITAVDGTRVTSVTGIQRALDTHKPGDEVDVQWTDANGRSHTASITLAEGPPG